ncbi:MAG: DEAD/DEAH box helicase, partial [Sulfurovum sp.]|nr:DEAD/DEAH box helicase [Sulfurovum sp.]
MSFTSFGLSESLLEILEIQELKEPTPIQKKLIPVLKNGSSIIASAQTGSGKTLAFLLPLLDMIVPQEPSMHHYPKLFILSPTKELAQQLYEVAKPYVEALRLRIVLLQGGGKRTDEIKRLEHGMDVVVATP